MASIEAINSAAECNGSEHVDPRVRRTRKLLQDAWRELIREKPYTEISVQHITERATVNRATFYAHYNDKQDLAVAVAKADLRAAIYSMFSKRPEFNRENLVLLGVVVFEFVDGIQKACPRALDLHADLAIGIQDEFYSMTLGWLGSNRAYAEMYPGVRREVLASVISCSFYGAALRWVRAGKREKAKEVCREIGLVVF